jgi:hypothetical protein
MYKVNNKPLPLDRAFTLGDIQYPSQLVTQVNV